MIPVGLLGGDVDFSIAQSVSVSLPANGEAYNIATDGTAYVATANYAGTTFGGFYSANGTSWSSITMARVGYWQDVDYGAGVWMATGYGNDSVSHSRYGARSTNGTTWTDVDMGESTSSRISSILYDGTRFCAWDSGSGLGKFLYSTDGTSWSRTATISGTTRMMLSYSSELAIYRSIAWGAGGTSLHYRCTGDPTNAANWSSAAGFESSLDYNISGNGIFLSGRSDTSTYYTATDGSAFTSRSFGITITGVPGFANGFFWVKQLTTNTVYYSADGINWISTAINASTSNQEYAWGGNGTNLIALGLDSSGSFINSGSRLY